MIEQTFAKRLNLYRLSNRKSLQDVADLLGVSKQTISNWESTNASPRLAELEKIAQKLGITEEWLLGYDTESEGAQKLGLKGNMLVLQEMSSSSKSDTRIDLLVANKVLSGRISELSKIISNTMRTVVELFSNRKINSEEMTKIMNALTGYDLEPLKSIDTEKFLEQTPRNSWLRDKRSDEEVQQNT